MIYYLTGTYPEASPFIKRYGMKKLMDIKKFQTFKGKNELLTISETEAVDASVSACHLLTLFPPGVGDIFVCVRFRDGLSAGGGGVEIYNKLRDGYSGRDFYPDMLAEHPFAEGICNDGYSALAYQTAVRFFPAHDIHIISAEPSGDFCENIAGWADRRAEYNFSDSFQMPEDIEEKIALLCGNLKLGYSLKTELTKLARNYAVRYGHCAVIDSFVDARAGTKSEGKKIYAGIAEELRK